MEAKEVYYSDLFKKIANGQKIMLNKGMSYFGITYVQSLVILHLSHMREVHGDAYEVSQKDIENYLLLAGSTVTHILARMEENGCIVRAKSNRDNRANKLVLTEKGASYVPLFFEVLDDVEQTMTAGMSGEERAALKALMEKVLDNMQNQRK